MRRIAFAAAAPVLAGPTALAFFSGGYLEQPRLVAALVAWAVVLVLAVAGPPPVPRGAAGWLAVGGLAAITAWSAISLLWAPLRGPAIENVQRLVLYVGALLAAIGVARDRRVARAFEPALAAGATVVIGYGLAGRLLPGLLHFARSRTAGGRLEQPITYWNGEGALAAVGLVLCARLAGDGSRPRAVRILAAAAVAPLGAGVYLTFSRGAIAVALLGLVCLVAAAPTRTQLRAAAVALGTAIAAVAATAFFPGVASLAGAHATRVREGAIALVLLAAVTAAGAAAGAALSRRTPAEDRLRGARRIAPAVTGLVVLTLIGLAVGGLLERPTRAELATGANATRLTTVSSNRYEYWRVGLDAFAHHPLVGLGSAGFRVEWLKRRTITETVRDVHSLELEMAAELGIVGLLAFLAMVGGILVSARRALRAHPGLAVGAAIAPLVWLLHASIDWDWELPAVSLPAIVLAGALIALSDAER